jgi:lipopolysaccharide/colanic/teichoic acid biosynthesis glycosyltransferase
MARPNRSSLWLKRIFDVVAASVLLLFLALPLLLISLVSLVIQGRPIFFGQVRPGLNGAPFRIIKFRTMLPSESTKTDPSTDATRMTAYGRFLRRSSIDELPELINVLKGEMSLVGPRPLLMEYLALYTPEQARRHEMLPGITGWAQVNGRNALNWEDRFTLDVLYIDNWSFWLDLKILALTVLRVFSKKDISAPGHATMPVFEGSQAPQPDRRKAAP